MLINGEEHNDLCVGIDLGTTNSVLATVNILPNGNIVSKVVELNRAVGIYSVMQDTNFKIESFPILPSCVYYDDERHYQPIVGDFAKSRYPIRPHLVAKSIKSQMGRALAEGLSANVPDKTPAQISSRILEHMLRNAAKIYRQEKVGIHDAVITVPANFDFVMRRATLEAAELAGIKIRNNDGSARQILLSEPRAVIYDFINQVRNGEIAAQILDLNTKKNVMVFDLGGGTLDITLHEISRRPDAAEVLKVQDLAINRYTLLGGDDFDLALAQTMYKHYLERYAEHNDIVQKIRKEERGVMSQLLKQAEDLKIKISSQKSDALGYASAWDVEDDDEEENYPVGGNIAATGYAYGDNFTATQLEDVWRDFMGENLKFDDYKNYDEIAARYGKQKNIILPILYVLNEAAKKLNTSDVHVDAVIMNGGMSRFYMVIDRLKEFFGFEPIVALNPDQAVARGAAVYHYFLHKYAAQLADEVQDDLSEKIPAQAQTRPTNQSSIQIFRPKTASTPQKDLSAARKITAAERSIGVLFEREILNESFYLVTFGGNYEEIIPAGKELPYTSQKFTGFRLQPGKNIISIPIARREDNGNYRIIAKGTITLPERYSRMRFDVFVTFSIFMNEDKIIRMDAYTCRDDRGLDIMDHCSATISIATDAEKNNAGSRPHSPTGGKVNPNQLNTVRALCRDVDKAFGHDNNAHSRFSKILRMNVDTILAANNPKDFAEPLLQLFDDVKYTTEESFKLRLATIARKIGTNWTAEQKRRLARLCLAQLDEDIYNPGIQQSQGLKVNTKMQCIYTLSMCGSEDDLAKLTNLHNNEKFRMANLYTHAMTKTDIDWVYYEFKKDYNKVMHGLNSNIQISAHALGLAFKLDGRPIYTGIRREQIVTELCNAIRSRNLNPVEITTCLKALGLLCDRRRANDLPQKVFDDVAKLFRELGTIYGYTPAPMSKVRSVAQKMINGEALTAEEEDSLLMKID